MNLRQYSTVVKLIIFMFLRLPAASCGQVIIFCESKKKKLTPYFPYIFWNFLRNELIVASAEFLRHTESHYSIHFWKWLCVISCIVTQRRNNWLCDTFFKFRRKKNQKHQKTKLLLLILPQLLRPLLLCATTQSCCMRHRFSEQSHTFATSDPCLVYERIYSSYK